MYAEKENHGDFSLFDSDLYSNSRSIDIQEPPLAFYKLAVKSLRLPHFYIVVFIV